MCHPGQMQGRNKILHVWVDRKIVLASTFMSIGVAHMNVWGQFRGRTTSFDCKIF